jgi:hypothetical protein
VGGDAPQAADGELATMRDREGTEANPPTGLTSVPWVVTDVQVLAGFRLRVRFIDGTEGEIDLSALIHAPTAGDFAPLRDPARFAEVTVTEGDVTWPGNLDLAPDAMYDRIRADGHWVVEPFKSE